VLAKKINPLITNSLFAVWEDGQFSATIDDNTCIVTFSLAKTLTFNALQNEILGMRLEVLFILYIYIKL
jgi:hypothetical protein